MLNAKVKVHTVSQACDADLAQVQCGCHTNIEGTLGNVISTVGHSNSKRALETQIWSHFVSPEVQVTKHAYRSVPLHVHICKCCSHRTCCTGVYFTVCVLSWLLMISKSLTASALVGPLKLQSRLAFPAPLVLTVKWVGLFNSTPEGKRKSMRVRRPSMSMMFGSCFIKVWLRNVGSWENLN